MRRMQERVEDYRQFGVANIWILDQGTRQGYDCRPSGWLEAIEFEIPNTPVRLVLFEIFARTRRSLQ
jgi:hypothetical protein